VGVKKKKLQKLRIPLNKLLSILKVENIQQVASIQPILHPRILQLNTKKRGSLILESLFF
jgi:hypothetical protein